MEKNFSNRLGSGYIQGYTKAIQDGIKIMQYIQPDLKHHKMQLNAKRLQALFQCWLQCREIIRDDSDAFIRVNKNVPGEFEVYVTGRGVYDPETMRIVPNNKPSAKAEPK